MCISYCFFFFKQKTAYEMRISDWSSDVCSSDLQRHRLLGAEPDRRLVHRVAGLEEGIVVELAEAPGQQPVGLVGARLHGRQAVHHQDEPPAVLHRRGGQAVAGLRSEEHTSELQSPMRKSDAVICLKKKKNQ